MDHPLVDKGIGVAHNDGRPRQGIKTIFYAWEEHAVEVWQISAFDGVLGRFEVFF